MSDGKEIQKWADDFMFEAEVLDPADGPRVWLLSCNPDPLGSIAAAAKAYKGEFVTSLSEITDEERRFYLAEVQKTALAMPLEAVHFHFRIAGVTRGFTHQMVRQRTAAYSQESTRFAVKSGVPVGLPPSLEGTISRGEWRAKEADGRGSMPEESWLAYEEKWAADQERWRFKWDETVEYIAEAYNYLVNSGMPAEDARGLLPTNLLTQLNYFTNLRNYKDEAGKRLCTQAQFEWRIVFSKMMEAIREYGLSQSYSHTLKDGTGYEEVRLSSSQWQFDAIANLFRPDCYYKGRCTFKADFDRKCSIRDRVDANAEINRPSSEWHEDLKDDRGVWMGIPAIRPEEWLLDPGAAR